MSETRDRSRLLGDLAIQMRWIADRELVAAMNVWLSDPQRSLGAVLVEQGLLGEGEHELLEWAVELQIQRHGSLQHSIAALHAAPAARGGMSSDAASAREASLPLFAETNDEASACTPSAAVGRATAGGGRFRILQRHARGGLGEVFLARDEELGREVAVKEIRREYADDHDLRTRFVREAEITGGLEHPGIVPVYGLGCHDDGRPFYAMRFIRGESLLDAIGRCHGDERAQAHPGENILAVRKLLSSLVHVCNATAYAHSRGVIHRDLKPENVMLGPYGETLLVDWGLAKVIGRTEPDEPGPEEETPPGELQATLWPTTGSPAPTRLGSTVGTLAYMSPEQAAGLVDQLSPASDIYGLGAMLYAILTGRPPFTETGRAQVRQEVIVGRFPRPRKVRPEIPPPLEAICLHAMALDPLRRYPSARALAEDIEAWLADEPVTAWRESLWSRTRRWMRRHRTWVTGVAATLVMAVVSLSIGVILLAAANEKVRQSQLKAQQREEDAQRNFQLARAAVDNYLTRVSEDPRLKAHDLERLRRDLLETARGFYEQFIQQDPEDPELRAAWGWAHFRLADITAEVGSKNDATELLKKAAVAFAALAQEHPDNAGYQSGLIQVRVDLARMYADTGRADEATAELTAAVALAEKLVRQWPNLAEFSMILAAIHNNMARLHLDADRLPEAEAAYRAAIAIREELLRRYGDVAQYQSQLAGNLANLSVVYRVSNRYAEATKALVAATEIQQELVDRYRDMPKYAGDLATMCDQLAELYRDMADGSAAAEGAMEAALRVRQRMAREHPAVTEYQYELARSLHGLARSYLSNRRFPAAEKSFHDLMNILEPLVAEHPEVPDYWRDMASATHNLAVLHAQEGRTDKATAMYEKAVALRRQLAAKYPQREDYQRELTEACRNLETWSAQEPVQD